MNKQLFSAMALGLGMVCANTALAQTGPIGIYNEALELSQVELDGTARSQAFGGPMVALPGEVGSILANPANIGGFNSSDFSFSANMQVGGSEGTYFNSAITDYRVRPSLPNITYIGSTMKDDVVPGAFRGAAFGFSLHKVNDFNRRVSFEQLGAQSTILNSYVQQLDLATYDQVNGGIVDAAAMAFFADLIVPDVAFDPNGFNDLWYVNAFADDPSTPEVELTPLQAVDQSGILETTGSQYQMTFTGGTNISDKLYLGANMGVVLTNYERVFNLTEQYANGALGEMTVRDRLDINAAGFNASFGAVFRPANVVQLGVSYTTPTFHSVTEQNTQELNTFWRTSFDTGIDQNGEPSTVTGLPSFVREAGSYSLNSDLFENRYSMWTPGRFSAGATVFLGNFGFVSATAERMNFASIELFNGLEFSTAADNAEINRRYQSTWVYRLGGEGRFENIRYRAGLAYFGDPVDDNVDQNRLNLSGGLGYTTRDWYLDLALVRTLQSQRFTPYEFDPTSEPFTFVYTDNDPGTVDPTYEDFSVSNQLLEQSDVDIKHRLTNVMVTVGFKF